MGRDLPGLALDLDVIDDELGPPGPYATLTKCFGEFINLKNSAYIDTNNCSFADQLLEQGIAEPTGLYKISGFCRYPFWIFKEEFLRGSGGENYQKYVQAYDQYMNHSEYGGSDQEE